MPPPSTSPPRAGEAVVPVAEGERQTMIDALRAIALLGIVLVNVAAYRSGVAPSLSAGGGALGGTVDPLTVGLAALTEGRFYPLFSFLFGWGFAVQDARSRVRGRSVVGPWLRRSAVLLGLGVLHAVFFFDGDILVTYAIVGALLPLVRRVPTAWVAAVGGTMLVFQALFTAGLVALSVAAAGDPVEVRADVRADMVADAEVYATGSFLDVARHRAGDMVLNVPFGLLSVGGTVGGMMLLGVAAARLGWSDPRRWPPALRRAAVPAWVVGILLSVPAVWLAGHGAVWPDDAGQAALSWLLYALLGPAVALAWAAVVLRTGEVPALRRAYDAVAPAGRLSLTIYLSQSVVFSLVFNGYGLGLGTEVGLGVAVAMAVALWLVQVVLARAWLHWFTMGPLEALARAVAYLRWTPLRRRHR